MIPYHWQYLPLLLQILAAFGLGAVMVVASWFVGRETIRVLLESHDLKPWREKNVVRGEAG